MVADAGLLAIGIEPVVVNTVLAVREHTVVTPVPKQPTLRVGTKQSMLIAMVQSPEGATMEAFIKPPHSARGAMSGALGKKLGLVATSVKAEDRGRVSRIDQPD